MNGNDKKALIIVDVQNDFISGSLALKNCPAKNDGADVVQIINNNLLLHPEVYDFWDIIVYTQEWHPANHCSFIENLSHANFPPDFDQGNIQKLKVLDTVELFYPPFKHTFKQQLWPSHCVEDTWGAQFHDDLIRIESGHKLKDVFILRKGEDPFIDCYSAFWSTDWLLPTNLEKKLKNFNIDTLYVCGIALDVCVYHTAKDSKSLGYKTYLIDDACRGVCDDTIGKALYEMKQMGIMQITSEEVYST